MPDPNPPLHLVINSASGAGAGATLGDIAKAICDEAGRELHIHMPARPGELDQLAQQVRERAERDGGIVAAAGGDGTVRSMAQLLAGTAVPLAVIPLGTFNFFARNYGIPEDGEAALRLALAGEIRRVQLGEVNGQLFLINASFGLYTDLIKTREMHASRWGRNRLVATASTLISLARGYPPLEIELATGQQRERLRTPMVFIGNNALQLRAVSLDVARCARQGQLAVVIMEPLSRWGMLRLACYGLARQLEREEGLHSFCADGITIGYRKRLMEVVMDGERLRLRTPLEFRIRRDALSLVVPRPPVAAEPAA